MLRWIEQHFGVDPSWLIMISGNWLKQERPTPARARRRSSADQRQTNGERGINRTYEKYLRPLQFVSKCGTSILSSRLHNFL
jgi:hypothetical protein